MKTFYGFTENDIRKVVKKIFPQMPDYDIIPLSNNLIGIATGNIFTQQTISVEDVLYHADNQPSEQG